MALRLLAQTVAELQHGHLGDDRNRLGRRRRERKQRRGRFLVRGRSVLKQHWLIDEPASSEVADCHDRTRATMRVAEMAFRRRRRSAAVLSVGMSRKPTPVKPDNFIERACHHDGALPKKCGQPLLPATRIADLENAKTK